ncbi:MAG: HAMP domain-containing sensor histidine kinase [Pseudomonadota bacterium]
MSQFSSLFRLSAVRHTLWMLGLFTFITLAAWGATYWLVQREMLLAVDARLAARMEAAIASLEAGNGLPKAEDGDTAELATTHRDEGFTTEDLEPDKIEIRFFVRTTDHGQVVLGEKTEREEELRDMLAAGMQLSLLATLLLTGVSGLWLARSGQKRLNTISTGLAAVAQGKLSERIVLDGQDDLSLLAARINATTERLEEAITQMRVQSSNIAHDLRTPLARLRAQIEASRTDVAEHRRAVKVEDLDLALEQIDGITGTFDALLRLSRIESGAGRESFRPVNLRTLVEDVVETFGVVVEDAGQSLVSQIETPSIVNGDWDMLKQALANLLQNALRHGAKSQTIVIRAHGSRLSVSDQGCGIPFAEREKVLQPLYQLQTTRQNEGFGLGLSLVRAISDVHGATLSLSDGPAGKGLTVTLCFLDYTEL